jgi:hypothetical protein
MSYIYALYFPKQKAVKIGKADNLTTRLSQLVATWGPISTSKARAWSVEDTFVLGAERDLHQQFDTYHKDMPEGDGYSEFFDPCIWDQLNHSQFLPISKTKILYKVNQTKALAPKTYQSVTLNVTEHEKEQLLTIYGDTATIKKHLFESVNLSLTNEQYNQLQTIKENEAIATLKRDNAILKNQVTNTVDTNRRLTVMKSENFRKLSEKDKTIGQLSNELNCYKNQGLLSDNDKSTIKLQLTISELKEENKRLNGRIRELKQRNERALDTYEKRRQLLKKAYRTMKKAVTQLKKLQTKPHQTLANELTEIINDIYLYT